ncbi:TetR/AcrR family transcriptional regulator [Dinoroseobacter sp. S124A]|uniref:TetR/AcrR family transcriptional regulator n=1 Tax=Dinoroseobacter sp. S124A TaxID=3415128 RepID=UPI003C7CF9E0
MRTDTKTALLVSAERAARARGFDGFSYADLAADVGIRKASIHHHFPSKAALAVALMARYHAELETACAGIDATHETGGARLTALIDLYRRALDEGRRLCLCVSFSTSRDSLPTEVVGQLQQFRQMMLGWIADVFARGQQDGTIAGVKDPELEAAATLPLLEGAHLAARAQEDASLFDAAVRMLAQRVQGATGGAEASGQA